MHRDTFPRRAVRRVLSVAAALLSAGVWVGAGVTQASAATGPCDIYATAGQRCVAAYSTTRAVLTNFGGSLYRVTRSSDNTSTNIGLLSTGGTVNVATQDTFCRNTLCTITTIFDQSGQGNDLRVSGGFNGQGTDQPARASAVPITIGGRRAYAVDIEVGQGYRHPAPSGGVAVNAQPEGMYMVSSVEHVNSGCCFDFGNVEARIADTGNGHMDAIHFGTLCWFGGCRQPGPWVQADLENGLFQATNGTSTSNTGNHTPFVTATLKNDGRTFFALKGGNSATGGLTTWFNGPLPPNGYSPMHQEGSVALGTGGDGSNSSSGLFFEGAMTAGVPSDATENAVQANIVAAGYGGLGRYGTIVSGINGSVCVDLANASTSPGVHVQTFSCNGVRAAQSWQSAPDGTIRIGGGCLDITGANNHNDNTPIEWWFCNGGSNQVWQVTNGQLVNPASGKCLTDPNSNTANGTQLVLFTCGGGANQRWTLP
jgi:non-reducing end alpha-L-arabinofuranosidase